MFTGGLRLLLSGLVFFNAIGAFAAAPTGMDHPCAPSKELSRPEHDAVIGFHARLSHLEGWYGKQAFETRLTDIVQKSWPRQTVVEMSPYFFEKVSNLVEQARLRNSLALTIGLDAVEWKDFERQLKSISLVGGLGGVAGKPLDQVAEKLLRKIGASVRRSMKVPKPEYDLTKAEAIARVVDMHTFMIRWKAMNREISTEHASAAAKKVAIVGIGLISGAVLVGGFAIATPVLAGFASAGAAAAVKVSATPAVSALLMGLFETAGGGVLGAIGAPAAVMAQESYMTLAVANMNSLNNQTVYSCELSKEIGALRQRAPGRMASAALLGFGMGLGGGVLTLGSRSAKAILWATLAGVTTAQVYALWGTGQQTLKSLAFYRLAQTAANEGNYADAKQYLIEARQHAVAGGSQALESIIVGLLTNHVAHNSKAAFERGAAEIRNLWANSADTVPTAAKSAISLLPIGPQPALASASCVPGAPNYALCKSQTAALASR